MEYHSFSVYRGLQKPLEFMGLKGRYVFIAAGSACSSVLLFIITYLIFGLLVSSILSLLVIVSGGIYIFTKQKRGLHSKDEKCGIYIFTHLMQLPQ